MATTTRERVQRGTRSSGDDQPCTTCGEVKPADDFPLREPGRRQSRCRVCRAAWRRDRRKQNPQQAKGEDRSYNIRRHRGMTEALFDRMFVEQQGRCGICTRALRADGTRAADSAHIDHDHTTGEVRELLCHRCNTGFGLLNEDVDVLVAAIEYALRHRKVTVDDFVGSATAVT